MEGLPSLEWDSLVPDEKTKTKIWIFSACEQLCKYKIKSERSYECTLEDVYNIILEMGEIEPRSLNHVFVTQKKIIVGEEISFRGLHGMIGRDMVQTDLSRVETPGMKRPFRPRYNPPSERSHDSDNYGLIINK